MTNVLFIRLLFKFISFLLSLLYLGNPSLGFLALLIQYPFSLSLLLLPPELVRFLFPPELFLLPLQNSILVL